jgi:methionyl-tRNA formyltransferase
MAEQKMRVLMVAEQSLLAEAALRALLDADCDVVEIWTLKDPSRLKRQSLRRHFLRSPRCVGTLIGRHRIFCRQIAAKDKSRLEDLLANEPPFDLLFCAGAHIIFPERFIHRFRYAANLHPSLLPYYGGPYPSHAMTFDDAQDRYGGMTLHVLTKGIDKGDIIGQRPVPRSKCRSVEAWKLELADAAYDLVRKELGEYLSGERQAQPQTGEQGCYVSLKEDDLLITESWSLLKLRRFLSPLAAISGRRKALVRLNGQRYAIAVTGPPSVVGESKGEPPRLARTFVEMDISGVRVRLKKETRLEKYRRIIELHYEIVARQNKCKLF